MAMKEEPGTTNHDDEIDDDFAGLVEVWNYISQIKTDLEEKDRFFTDQEFLNRLDKLFKECETTLPKSRTFFRARIYKERDKYERMRGSTVGQQFEGYDSKGSFVNTSSRWPSGNRMNPQGVQALYMSTDVKTCITELHPGYGELISVATIKPKEPLKIVDLSQSASGSDDLFSRRLSVYIQELISQGYSERDYIFPQYIASYCVNRGYDGIAYRSKYYSREVTRNRRRKNITIFNYDKCEAVSSKLYTVKRIYMGIEKITPKKTTQSEA